MKSLLMKIVAAAAITAATSAFAAQLGTTYSNVVQTTESVMFTGVSLADVRSVSAWITGGSMGTAGQSATATAYHYSNDGSTLTVQFHVNLGNYTKCVKLLLEQDGDDIKGKIANAAYFNDEYTFYEGEDMEGSNPVITLAGYRICNVTLSDEDDAYLRTKLYWNGASGDTWGGETQNWLTESGVASAWVPGARAVFTNATPQTIAVAASGVTVSHFSTYGRKVTFTGGTITLVGAAELIRYAGGARFECPLAGETGFRAANGHVKADYSTSTAIPGTSTLILSNATLADIENLMASPYGSIVGADSTPMQSHFLENDGSTLTAQMQWYGGGFTKCVFLELTQQGSDIYGRVTEAAYINIQGKDFRGVDFRTHPNVKTQTLFDGSGNPCYGLRNLHLGSRIEFAGANTFTGLLRADNALVLALDGGTLCGGTFSDVTVIYRATLEIAHTHQTFAKTISDSTGGAAAGRVVVKGTVDPSGGTLTYSGNLQEKSSDAEITVFRNANLAAWTDARAQFAGTSMTDKNSPAGTPFYFRHTGDKVRVQFQVQDFKNSTDHNRANGYVKCAIYDFTQVGSDIVCKKYSGAYKTNMDTYFGYDFERDSAGNLSYTAKNLVVTYTNATDTVVRFAAGNDYSGGTEINGAVLVLSEVGALPRSKGLHAWLRDGAKLFVDKDRPSTVDVGVLGDSTVYVTEGSFMRFGRFRSGGSRNYIEASGGSAVSVCSGNGDGSQNYSYLARLTLSDGAFVTGDVFRTGAEGTNGVMGIIVEQTGAAASVNIPFCILRATTSANDANFNKPWNLSVANVTDSEDVDLFLNGELRNYTQNGGVYGGRTIQKTGAGTVRLGAANSYTGAVSIVEGAVLLGTNGAFNANLNLTLAGGTLDAGTSTNAVGALSVISNSTLAVSAGAELSFANSSALDWGSSLLTITGASEARTLRFGTDGNGLTRSQVRQIRWDGFHVKLDSSGYLAPHIDGTAIYFK